MKFLRGSNPTNKLSCVLSIGTFDGVHLGHQFMLSKLKKKGEALGLPTVLLCFEPHPKEFFAKDSKPFRLMNIREKLHLINEIEIDYVWCLSFNKSLSTLTARDFVDKILLSRLDVKSIIVGNDFQYGYKRQGDIESLTAHGSEKGFDVEAVDLKSVGDKKISSTAIRLLLSEGDFNAANSLLGHDYFMMGRVIHGDKRGRQIGVPTANIAIRPVHRPLHGVYAAYITLADGRKQPGVANIGYRPTVDGQNFLLEAHLFDFNEDLYDQRLKVTFIEKIRGEKKFNSFDELIKQIKSDIQSAKERLNAHD